MTIQWKAQLVSPIHCRKVIHSMDSAISLLKDWDLRHS